MLASKDVGLWYPGVGTAMLVLDMEKQTVLLGKRKGGVGAGMWCPPGGRAEHNEDLMICARRETTEDAGIEVVGQIVRGPYTEDRNRPDKYHWITAFFAARAYRGEVRVCESEKCEKWDWFKWNELPTPLFYPMHNLLALGYDPFKAFSVSQHELSYFKPCQFGDGGYFHADGADRVVCSCGWQSAAVQRDKSALVALWKVHRDSSPA